jgi:hypothetical protein
MIKGYFSVLLNDMGFLIKQKRKIVIQKAKKKKKKKTIIGAFKTFTIHSTTINLYMLKRTAIFP